MALKTFVIIGFFTYQKGLHVFAAADLHNSTEERLTVSILRAQTGLNRLCHSHASAITAVKSAVLVK